jgi:hypothetical protein
MIDLDNLLAKDEVKKEYRRTFLLCMFQKICAKMERNKDFDLKIRNLFRQSSDFSKTVRTIIKNNLNFEISIEDAHLMSIWFEANLKKMESRKKIPDSVKKDLYQKQKGKCVVCGEDLGSDWSKIHVDHIIPFKLVGDELPDNYQDLCDCCNKTKSARIDFLFRSMLKLI